MRRLALAAAATALIVYAPLLEAQEVAPAQLQPIAEMEPPAAAVPEDVPELESLEQAGGGASAPVPDDVPALEPISAPPPPALAPVEAVAEPAPETAPARQLAAKEIPDPPGDVAQGSDPGDGPAPPEETPAVPAPTVPEPTEPEDADPPPDVQEPDEEEFGRDFGDDVEETPEAPEQGGSMPVAVPTPSLPNTGIELLPVAWIALAFLVGGVATRRAGAGR
jgi:hypothetical protein